MGANEMFPARAENIKMAIWSEPDLTALRAIAPIPGAAQAANLDV